MTPIIEYVPKDERAIYVFMVLLLIITSFIGGYLFRHLFAKKQDGEKKDV